MTTTRSHLSHLKYRPDIDGLRAFAVLAVVIYHAFPSVLKGGFVGVDVFFVISGFLISMIIFENLDRGTFEFSEFYLRRIRRIFPALIVVLLSCLIFGWFILLADEFNQLGKHVAGGASFVSNLVLWSEAGYFDASAETKPLLHLWSLGVEEQFYIFWPLLLWLAWKRGLSLLPLMALVFIISISLNFWQIGRNPVATFYSPLTRFWELLAGALLAWVSLERGNLIGKTRSWTSQFVPSFTGRWTLGSLGGTQSLLGLFLLGVACLFLDKDVDFPGVLALIPVLGTVLIISAGPQAWFNRVILSSKVAVWFGLISFPLYLWHWPILAFGRIFFNELPPRRFRLLAVVCAIFLAWLTVRLIEKPFRFGRSKAKLKLAALFALSAVVGALGFAVYRSDFTGSHSYEKLVLKRKGFEHAFGFSLAWYRGREDWLFLGNAYDNTVAKFKLASSPTQKDLDEIKKVFSEASLAALKHNAKIALIVGPNKSTVYSEYLPDRLVVPERRYVEPILDILRKVPNLIVYDPARDLINKKSTEGILYWKTDTHWNSKGAYIAYSGFASKMGLPVAPVEFFRGSPYEGDLIRIGKLKDFPLDAEDNWEFTWLREPAWTETKFDNVQETSFGSASVVFNRNPLSSQYVWVVGDSFAGALKPYFNATFKEVRYVGSWITTLKQLPLELEKAQRKPDLVVIVRVERSF